MKKFLLLASMLLTLSFNAFSQQPGTPDYLLVKNGFKIFKLGTPITNYKHYIKPILKIGESAKYEVTDAKFLTIGNDIQLDKIVLRTLNEKLSEIEILIDDPYKIKFYAALKAAYGDNKSKYPDDIWAASNGRIMLFYSDQDESKQNRAVASFVGPGNNRKK